MTTKDKIFIAVLASILLVTAALEVSAGGKVYFYEAKTQGSYKIANEYSAFKNKLKENGYDVNVLQAGLTGDALKTIQADVLVIPNLASDLTDAEKRAVFEFVSQDGKGVFICGATPAVNKFTIPLGMMVTEDMLEDEDNKIRDTGNNQVTEKTSYRLTPPMSRTDPTIKSLLNGVSGDFHVFGAYGIYLFGDSKGVLFSPDATNSPKTLVFPKGSNPPIAAYIRLGNGTFFLLTDADMMANKYVDASKYRNYNIKLGVNIIDWLSKPYPDSAGLDEQQVDEQLKAYDVENERLNRTLSNAQSDLAKANEDKVKLAAQIAQKNREIDELSQDKFMNVSYSTWAMLLLAAGFFLTVAFMLKGRKEAKKKGKGELGYEFKEAEEKAETEAASDEFSDEAEGVEGNIKEEDIEERLKELEKKKK